MSAKVVLRLPLLVLFCGAVAGGSWLQRGRRPQYTEVESSERLRGAEEPEVETRNKIYMPTIALQDPRMDWDTDPTAIPALMYQIEKRTGIPTWGKDYIEAASREIFEYPLIYMTAHHEFSFTEQEVKNIREHIERGGTLLIDDCLPGESAFGKVLPSELRKIFPNHLLEIISNDPTERDPKYEDLFTLCYPFKRTPKCTPGPHSANFDPWMAIWYRGRPVVMYSRADAGCAWEIGSPPTPSNPIGDDVGHGGGQLWRELIYRFSVNWILYAITH